MFQKIISRTSGRLLLVSVSSFSPIYKEDFNKSKNLNLVAVLYLSSKHSEAVAQRCSVKKVFLEISVAASEHFMWGHL